MRPSRVRAIVDAGRYASGPLGVRSGTVREFERPMRITFHQPMTMKLPPTNRRRTDALNALPGK
jgi:hypothetical protein